jgi:hypothetical protein
MALTRAMLKSMNLSDEQINTIIEEHTSIKDNLKNQISDLQEKVNDYDEIKQKYEDLSNDVKQNNWKDKFDEAKKQLEDYKNEIKNEKQTLKKKELYKELLKESGINDKQISSILEVTKFDDINIDENNKLENAEELTNEIKSKWDGFIVKSAVTGINTENPPTNNGGTSKEEIMKIKDPVERQQEIAKHLELFN